MTVITTPNIVKLDEGLTNLGFTLDEATWNLVMIRLML
jgi:hypothetical protein